MAPQVSSPPEAHLQEARLLGRLLDLYEEERQIYVRILELSRDQGDRLRAGAPLNQVRSLLEQKKNCLDMISRLEKTEYRTKLQWEEGRHRWSASGRGRLHQMLRDVATLMETIIHCEEQNDMVLIEQGGVL